MDRARLATASPRRSARRSALQARRPRVATRRDGLHRRHVRLPAGHHPDQRREQDAGGRGIRGGDAVFSRHTEKARQADQAIRYCSGNGPSRRSEEHTSELQSLMRISYAVFCLQKKKKKRPTKTYRQQNKIKST